jgi:hypothetical protein
MSLDAPLVQSMAINRLFGLVIALFESLPRVACLFDCIDRKVSLTIIEKGLSLFMRRHFVAFAGTHRWRSVFGLLSLGMVKDGQFSLIVFRDLLIRAREAAGHFHECWRPVLEVLVALIRSGKTAQTLGNAPHRDPHADPVVRRLHRVAMFKVAANSFFYALPVLEKSPRFEGIWFRVLVQALERAQFGDGREEIPEILANALKVMKAARVFGANRPKLWELTKSNIEAAFLAEQSKNFHLLATV